MARGARFALCWLALCCGLPSLARAWTEAQVTSVSGRVEIAPDASLHVRLDLKVAVHGGFLAELELAGLDPGLELDGGAPIVLTNVATGAVHTPAVEVRRDGRVALRFASRAMPRRGQYAVTLAYTSSLAERGVAPLESGDVRLTWTLPGWRSGLDAVRLTFVAPRGAVPRAGAHWDDRTVRVARRDLGDRVEIALERAHLARTVPWIIELDVPRASVSESLRASVRERAAPPLVPSRRSDTPRSPFVVAALATLLALAKRAAFARAARARACTPRPLVPIGSPWLHALGVVGAGATAATFPLTTPIAGFAGYVALVLLTVERTPDARTRGRLGGFRALRRDDLGRARRRAMLAWLEPVSLLDPTRPLGMLLAAATVGALAWMHASEPRDPGDAAFTTWHALVFFACQWLVASARLLPSTAEERLVHLLEVSRRFRVPLDTESAFAQRLVVYTDLAGELVDVRLRVVAERRASGLLRLDVAIADRAAIAGHVREPVWLVVTRAESEADAQLEAVIPTKVASVAPGGRRARVLPYAPRSLAALRPLLRETPSATPTDVRRAS